MKKTLLHTAILAVLSLSAQADGFKSGAVPVQVKQETTQQSAEPLKTEVKITQKEDHADAVSELKTNVAKLNVSSEQHQNFIWDQEKINKDQSETNKHQEEVNQKLATTINKTADSINKTSSNCDYNRLRNRIQDLEYANDRLKSTVNSLESRLNTLERRVR